MVFPNKIVPFCITHGLEFDHPLTFSALCLLLQMHRRATILGTFAQA